MTARGVPGKCTAGETKKTLLICDLDGTLVDSYPGIAEALRHACRTVGVEPRIPLDQSIVGPPLDDLLRSVTGKDSVSELLLLREAFVAFYDSGACYLSQPFAGVSEMLESVHANGHTLSLATNKRLLPTTKLLGHLRWRNYFREIETVDSQPAKHRSKTQILTDILQTSAGHSRVVYLGDTSLDQQAAATAGIPFIIAAWGETTGYGPAPVPGDWHRAAAPSAVLPLLNGLVAESYQAKAGLGR